MKVLIRHFNYGQWYVEIYRIINSNGVSIYVDVCGNWNATQGWSDIDGNIAYEWLPQGFTPKLRKIIQSKCNRILGRIA